MKNPDLKKILMPVSSVVFSLLFLTFFLTGCSKKNTGCMDVTAMNYDKDAEEDDGSCVLAGKGGNNTIHAFPEHHHVPIYSVSDYKDTAYVKFNTLDFPGDNPSLYDLVIKGEGGKNFVDIKRLKPGHYYIFMTGWDPSIQERVTGGIPVTITQTNSELDLDVPVTE